MSRIMNQVVSPMNNATQKRIFEVFEKAIQGCCNNFFKEKRYSIKESIIFKLSVLSGPALFVCLILIDTYEGFNIELAVSDDGDYPFYNPPDGKPYQGRWRVGLPALAGMESKNGVSGFWQIAAPMSIGKMAKYIEKGSAPAEAPVAEEKIDEVVADALRTLQHFGIPFFERILNEKGLKVDWHKNRTENNEQGKTA
jgi:hypothetical protein